MTRREIIATAIANARAGRRGVPFISNVLDMIPDNLRAEVLDDAEAVERAIDGEAHAPPSREGDVVTIDCGKVTIQLYQYFTGAPRKRTGRRSGHVEICIDLARVREMLKRDPIEHVDHQTRRLYGAIVGRVRPGTLEQSGEGVP